MNWLCSRERKGSVMVEASVIYPIIIFTILTLIYLLSNLFSEVVVTSNIHLLLSEEASEISRIVTYDESENNNAAVRFQADSVNITRKKFLFDDVLTGTCGRKDKSRGIVNIEFERFWEAEKNVINEEEFIRWCDLGIGIVKEVV